LLLYSIGLKGIFVISYTFHPFLYSVWLNGRSVWLDRVFEEEGKLKETQWRLLQVTLRAKDGATCDHLEAVGFQWVKFDSVACWKAAWRCKMPQRFRKQSGGVDSDQIGRTGGRRNRERSVNSELARRLRGFNGPAQKTRSTDSSSRGMRQRVIVKALVSRHKAGKSAGSLGRHVSYLGRESASADGKHGVFYNAERQGVDAKQGPFNGRKTGTTSG
jgi:hypothetical protein